MADHKKQHYLAISYLKGFSAGTIKGQHQIWVLDKPNNEIHLSAIDNAAAFSYYYSRIETDGSYDNSIEEQFSVLESQFMQFMEKVRLNIAAANTAGIAPGFTFEDRDVLCRYIFLHFLRVPKSMDWIRQSSEKHHKRMEEMGLLQFGETVIQNTVMKSFAYINKQLIHRVIQILSFKNMAIEFGVRKSASVFTCDNPVIRYNPHGANGIIHEDTQVLFPLYSRAYIRMQGLGNKLMVAKHHDLSIIDEINQAILLSAEKEVYANEVVRLEATAHRAGIRPNVRRPLGVSFD